MVAAPTPAPPTTSARAALIDCDIHVMPPSVDALLPYLDEHWREYIRQTAFKGASDTSYPRNAPTTSRQSGSRSADPDLTSLQPNTGGSSNGSVAGSADGDLVSLQQQVLDPQGVAVGILLCTYATESIHNPDAAAAMAAAVNDWQVAEWLEREPRLRGTLVIPSTHPDLAAREIDRLGDHPGMVQVFLPVRSEAPYGNRRYHPIFAAAARHNLAGTARVCERRPTGWLTVAAEVELEL